MFSNKSFKDYLFHAGLIVVTFLVICYLFFYVYLPQATHHGESIDVPDLKSLSIEEATQVIEERQLRYQLFDSTYLLDAKPHTIIAQFPQAGEKVKSNRTIYITISSLTPPMIKMPKLTGSSFKSAEMVIKSYGLALGKVSYVPNSDQGAVLKQMANGQTVTPGSSLEKGTIIDLVVSSGLAEARVAIPNLVDLDIEEAKSMLGSLGLQYGTILPAENPRGKVTRQKPEYIEGDSTNTLNVGDVIDLWVTGN